MLRLAIGIAVLLNAAAMTVEIEAELQLGRLRQSPVMDGVMGNKKWRCQVLMQVLIELVSWCWFCRYCSPFSSYFFPCELSRPWLEPPAIQHCPIPIGPNHHTCRSSVLGLTMYGVPWKNWAKGLFWLHGQSIHALLVQLSIRASHYPPEFQIFFLIVFIVELILNMRCYGLSFFYRRGGHVAWLGHVGTTRKTQGGWDPGWDGDRTVQPLSQGDF